MKSKDTLGIQGISYAAPRRILFLVYGVLFLLIGSLVSVGFLEKHVSPDGLINPSNHISINYLRIATMVAGLVCIAAAISKKRGGRRLQRLDEYLVKVGTLVTAVLLCSLMLEGGVRLFLYAKEETLVGALKHSRPSTNDPEKKLRLIDVIRLSDNKALIYELIPRSTGILFGAPIAINEYGYRGRPYPHERPERTFRIIGIGDSVAFGIGVDVEDTYLRIMERLFVEAGIPCEVVNLAVPGYNTAMEVELLAWKGLAYNPDLIILSFCENDFSLPNYLRLEHSFLTLKRCVLYDLLSRYEPFFRGLEPSPWGDGLDADALERIPHEYRYMVGREGVSRAFRKLGSIAQARNIPVIVEYYDGSYDGILDGKGCRENDTQLFLERTCSELGFYYRDCTQNLYDYAAGSQKPFREIFWLKSRDPHPSRTAHRLIAECLKDFILAHELARSHS